MSMITSRQNRLVQEVRGLDRRRDPARFLLEGPNVLREAMAAGIMLDLVLHAPGAPPLLRDEAVAVALREATVSDDILAYAADSQHPQGIVALARVPVFAEDDATCRVLVLEEVRDPGNLGTVTRTAWAAGFDTVLLAGQCVDPWSPKVVRAAAGATFHVPVRRFPMLDDALAWLDERDLRLVGARSDGAEPCFDADLKAPLALVLGSEAHGISDEMAARCESFVRIPMARGCES
ncbi:MAG: RNA methyltransferase, partial [Armatimonadetes bacterium]|nr:RNA methyltransferase [Armatimonadota bacterium]